MRDAVTEELGEFPSSMHSRWFKGWLTGKFLTNVKH